jgi:hypothetical protein
VIARPGGVKNLATPLHTRTHITKWIKFWYVAQKYGGKFKRSTLQLFVAELVIIQTEFELKLCLSVT